MKTSVILFSIDEYYYLIKNVIKSFNNVKSIDKFYILHYDQYKYVNSENIIHIDLSRYNYNVNECYNNIRLQSDVWVIWKPTYYFNVYKVINFNHLIESVHYNKFDICFIFGIKLFLDVYHTKTHNEYSCRNGGCFIISNKVTLNENEIYFNVNKSTHKINYNLYDDNEYYFFDVSVANSGRIMLLNDFESMYIEYLKRNNDHINFEQWYEKTHNDINVGSQYVKKKYIFDGRNKKQLHNYPIKEIKFIENNKLDLTMTFVQVVSTLGDISLLSITVNSLRDQYLCERKWNLLIIVNGNFGHHLIEYNDDFINVLYLNNKISVSDCYDIAINNINNEIVTFIKPGIKIEPQATQLILDVYNNSMLDNVFVYQQIINTKMIKIDNNDINKCFVSIKKKYYSKVIENTFCNENMNLLLKIETMCRPICLSGLIDIKHCNVEKETTIEKYLFKQMVNSIKKNKEENQNILNVYFDKIYSRTNLKEFDNKSIQYEINLLNENILIDMSLKNKLNTILIINNDDQCNNFDYESAIKMLLNKYHNFNKIVFNLFATGYILNSKQNNTYYSTYCELNNNVITFDPYPKISVVMTVYNKEKYVEHAIKSVLRQTYQNIELIIVEDCSTDNSLQIVNKFSELQNVKIICNKQNLGCYSSRNIAIDNSTGSIIAFQDADDYTLENRLEIQLNLMLARNLLMVGCNMIRSHIDNINYENDISILNDVEKNIKHFDCDCCSEMFGYPTLLIKKELFDKYGKYIERPKGMDMEFPERIMFKELGKKFIDSSWGFFDKESNQIYEKIDKLLVISPEMNLSNITNQIATDDYLKNKLWRNNYV